MTHDLNTSRRSFLKGSAIVAAPLAAVIPTAAFGRNAREHELAAIEDEHAISKLRDAWLRHVRKGNFDEARAMMPSKSSCSLDDAVCAITANYDAEPGQLSFAENGLTATQNMQCVVASEILLEKDCTITLMMHAQGTPTVRREDDRTLQFAFARTEAGWTINEAVLV